MSFKEFLQKIKSRDAIVLFAHLTASGSRQYDTTLANIAVSLNRENWKTARGVAWSADVVRVRLRELADAGLVEVVSTASGVSVVILTPPDDGGSGENDVGCENDVPPDNCRKLPETPVFTGSGGCRESYRGGCENDDASARAFNSNNIYYNNINKKINKQTNKKSKQLFFDFPTDAGKPFAEILDAGRNHPDFLSIRSWLVKQLWEPGLRSELIDRIAAAIIADLPGLSRHNVQAIINTAGDAVLYYENTNGLRGRKNKRDTVAPYLRQCLDAAGFAWTPTAPDLEPQPQLESRRVVLSPVSTVDETPQTPQKPALNTTRRKIISALGDRVKTLDYQQLSIAIRGVLRCDDNTARVEALAIRQFIRQSDRARHSHLVSVETP